MATQKEALLEVYLDVEGYLRSAARDNPSVKYLTAIEQISNLIRRRIDTLNKQIDVYENKLLQKE